ncbi:MAG TPA: cupin domain-containing protein [Pararobbsia sp.]|nr:cupin domain-containing protein [Pararobbsia sp.]
MGTHHSSQIMQKNFVHSASCALDALRWGACNVHQMTDGADPHWAGIVDIAPLQTYSLGPGLRHDVYVLQGGASLGEQALVAHDFVVECGLALICAGKEGARLFHYTEALGSHCERVFSPASERTWHSGPYARTRVATLSNGGHRVSLVSWEPGARAANHAHVRGAEIFVVSGELRDFDDRHPSGTWLRLQPGEWHESFVDVPTVTLLRNGHLFTRFGFKWHSQLRIPRFASSSGRDVRCAAPSKRAIPSELGMAYRARRQRTGLLRPMTLLRTRWRRYVGQS